MRALAPACAAAVALAAPQAPSFKATVDAVRVDVLVTDGRAHIGGLTGEDFELRDNGVLQRIARVDTESVPLDLVLLLDTSASVAGPPLVRLQDGARAAIRALRAGDRAVVLAFSHRVTRLSPLTGDPAQLGAAFGDARAAGSTALFDAVAAGLLASDDPGRRSLVLVYSDGVDTASWLQADDALDIAARCEAVVYAIAAASHSSPWSRRLPGANLQTGPYRGDFPPLTSRAQIMGAPAPGHLQFLQDLAERSGGRLLLADAGDLERAFREIADEFRQRYVLSYSPEGVERRGWHQLDVTLTRRQGQVKARRGYFGS